jgi:hypothetical protein
MNRKARRVRWLAAAVLLGGFLVPTFLGAQSTQPKLSDKQAKELIATAKEPADHQKLAAYYRGKADEAKAAIAEHQEMLAAYAKNPSTHALAKAQGGPTAMCNDLIRIYRQEQKADLELAGYHDNMAKEAAKP